MGLNEPSLTPRSTPAVADTADLQSDLLSESSAALGSGFSSGRRTSCTSQSGTAEVSTQSEGRIK